jgi:hypothetical protein
MIEGARPPEMPGFIKPQLATLKSKAPIGDQWLHEIKYDGYRIQIHPNKGRRKVYTPNGLDWTERFSVIAGASTFPVRRSSTARWGSSRMSDSASRCTCTGKGKLGVIRKTHCSFLGRKVIVPNLAKTAKSPLPLDGGSGSGSRWRGHAIQGFLPRPYAGEPRAPAFVSDRA